MKLKLFDLHCDTPLTLYKNNFHLESSPAAVSLKKASELSEYVQIMAFWADEKLADDTAFFAFHKAADYLNFEVERLEGEVAYARSGKDLESLSVKNKLMLSVEDARILCGRLDRLSVLYARGIRFLIPVWGGKTIIGGAHDTDEGLTEFGKSVIDECFKLGIIPDISHSSEKTAQEIFDIAECLGKAVMASHSNSYSICPHSRNLRDYQFDQVRKSGGIVGISLCSLHLTQSGEASIDDVVRHIEHYLSLGGENTVALGCDFDGTDMLPKELRFLDDMPRLADRLAQLGYTDKQINKIFYQNAKDFIDKNL